MNVNVQQWLAKHPMAGEAPIDRLWNRLDGMYPSLWAKNFPADSNAFRNWREAWAEAFAEDGITPAEIASGLRNCRKNCPYPPTLPEFIAQCRPPIDYDKAFCEAVHQMGRRRRPVVREVDGEVRQYFEEDVWSNPAVYWAARAMGSDLDKEYKYVKPRWAYELDLVLAGEVKPVPKNTNLLPDNSNKSKHLTPEEQKNVEDMLAKVRAMFDEEEKPQ